MKTSAQLAHSLIRWFAPLGLLTFLAADCGRQADEICLAHQKATGCTLGEDCDWCDDNETHHCSGWGEHSVSSCPEAAPCTTDATSRWAGMSLCVQRTSCEPGPGPYCDASAPDTRFECIPLTDGTNGLWLVICPEGKICGKDYNNQLGCH